MKIFVGRSITTITHEPTTRIVHYWTNLHNKKKRRKKQRIKCVYIRCVCGTWCGMLWCPPVKTKSNFVLCVDNYFFFMFYDKFCIILLLEKTVWKNKIESRLCIYIGGIQQTKTNINRTDGWVNEKEEITSKEEKKCEATIQHRFYHSFKIHEFF